MSYFGIDHTYGLIRLATFHAAPLTSLQSSYTLPEDIYKLISDALRYFSSTGYDKVIIEISQNPGRDIRAGSVAFQAFFPSARSYHDRDRRLSPLVQASSRAALNDSEGNTLSPLESAAARRISTNVAGHNYSSCAQFLAPEEKNVDYFTSLSRKNVSAEFEAVGERAGVGNVSFSGAAPFAAETIMLVSDSLCASTCSVFAEVMREKGVRGVAYGGPASSKGRLQVPGGTKG